MEVHQFYQRLRLDGLRMWVVENKADARDLVMTTLRRCQAGVTAVAWEEESALDATVFRRSGIEMTIHLLDRLFER
jgi:hypothetical protein